MWCDNNNLVSIVKWKVIIRVWEKSADFPAAVQKFYSHIGSIFILFFFSPLHAFFSCCYAKLHFIKKLMLDIFYEVELYLWIDVKSISGWHLETRSRVNSPDRTNYTSPSEKRAEEGHNQVPEVHLNGPQASGRAKAEVCKEGSQELQLLGKLSLMWSGLYPTSCIQGGWNSSDSAAQGALDSGLRELKVDTGHSLEVPVACNIARNWVTT